VPAATPGNRSRAELGDRHIQCACTGVEFAVAEPVALVGPIRAALTVSGAAQGVGFGAEQGMDERGEQLAQDVGVGGSGRSANTVGNGHRVVRLPE
jgi:hypothetical protein